MLERKRWPPFAGPFLVLFATAGPSVGAEPEGGGEGASGSMGLSTKGGATSSGSFGRWLGRYRPEAGALEVGILGGAFFPSKDHNLHDERIPHQRFGAVAPEIGLRAAYSPIEYVGPEIEGGFAFTKTEDGASATLVAPRAHLVGQLPLWRITPFALVGVHRLFSKSDSLGDDADPGLHFGLGVKAAITRLLTVRLDGRDNLTQKNGAPDGTLTHQPEVLLGLSVTPFRPPAVPDTDADRDGDGFVDADDECPEVAGVEPDGCPSDDPDEDGIAGDDDRCPEEAETDNGYEDADGCPDEMPAELKKLTGVVKGIEFDTARATIRPGSRSVLDEAARVLLQYPDLRVLITGHTDSDGDHAKNMTLSKQRAESVKRYLVKKGVGEDRLETRGAGPDEPIASNDTAEGKQQNRRIELQILKR